MYPRGNTYARRKVTGRKRDANGNVVPRMNNNPILDMSEYCYDFDDGDIRKVMENVIAESMYATFDDSVNWYLMMGSIVYYCKNDKSVTVPDQKVVHIVWGFMHRSTVG